MDDRRNMSGKPAGKGADMATNAEKMIQLVREGVDYPLPEEPMGKSVIRDEDGKDRITFGFNTKREILREVGYQADPEIAVDVVAAIVAVTKLVKDRKTMEAWLVTKEEIAGELSDDGQVDQENQIAVELAYLLLKEALKEYSVYYTEHK